MVEVTDLHMYFGAVRALTGVSFVARDGAITGLLGENGDAGKTTTVTIVCGLHEPMRGRDRRSLMSAALCLRSVRL